VLELLGSGSPIVHRPLPVDDPGRRCPDVALARTALGWEPTTGLPEGLSFTAAALAEEIGVLASLPPTIGRAVGDDGGPGAQE
jgi:nucleoside-diphosphate-sugar epimerase